MFVWVSRCLLVLTAISLITMPITEHLWTWDRFLQGGWDFELSSIVLLSFLCLVMVLARCYKYCVDVLLFARSCLAAAFDGLVALSVAMAGAFLNLRRGPPPDPGICTSDIPIRI
jgi:hypothetical protein